MLKRIIKNKLKISSLKKKEENIKQPNTFKIPKDALINKSKVVSGRAGAGKTFYLKKELEFLLKSKKDKLIIILDRHHEYDEIIKSVKNSSSIYKEKEIINLGICDNDFFKTNILDKNSIILFNINIFEGVNQTKRNWDKNKERLRCTINDLFIQLKENKELETYIILDELDYIIDEHLLNGLECFISNTNYKSHIVNVTTFYNNESLNSHIMLNVLQVCFNNNYHEPFIKNNFNSFKPILCYLKLGQHILIYDNSSYYLSTLSEDIYTVLH